jgi:hypothetical protein
VLRFDSDGMPYATLTKRPAARPRRRCGNYLGSRFAWQTPEAVEGCARWCDVVSFNIYRRSIAENREEWARFHALGRPALIGEFHYGSADRGLFWEGLVGVQSLPLAVPTALQLESVALASAAPRERE